MKRGSALLIVLGMLAFMVISAVAFSAFMRFSRMPSSYLRRTSSSRHLVKAALAEAIDIVDAAIADNPHPGVGAGAIQYPRGSSSSGSSGIARNRNYWRSHIFTGTNQLVSAADTVSTLTLEGIAYLPTEFRKRNGYLRSTQISKEYDMYRQDYCGCVYSKLERESQPPRGAEE